MERQAESPDTQTIEVMEAEAPHTHHSAHTGHRWLDISLALSAFFVSLVSLWLAMHHGQTMEKLVASNSYPNIDVEFSNNIGFDQRGYVLALQNTGIGPARIQSVTAQFQGKPVTGLQEMLLACCGLDVSPKQLTYFNSGDIRGALVPAGRRVELFRWPQPAADEPLRAPFDRFGRHRAELELTVCYCSVFDECYVRSDQQIEPLRVDACPIERSVFRG